VVGGPYTLTQPAAVTITVASLTNTQCNTASGQVILVSSDASTITVNGVTHASPATFTGLTAGYYTATSNGTCPASVSFNIINTNSTLAATVSAANPLCHASTGSATVSATGGTVPYTYSINGGAPQGTGIFAGLAAGNYNVIVTDANNCTYGLSFTITQPSQLVSQITSVTNNLFH